MKNYTTTVGLEIHAELKTQTKMFCDSRNDPHAAEPNVHICPVCMAFPGTLPVVNRQAVEHVLRVGVAVGGTLADFTEFDRKNYFYPDIPKGYQISQYKYPLVSGGSLRDVALTRIHLEEDTARSQHTGDGWSLIDFNRAGVPLMELVTEPVIHDAQTASLFAQELQTLLRTLGVSDANMEKGEMRVEANISVSQNKTLGVKVEVKNLNSFKAVEKAIEFETRRHIAAIEKGEEIVQETRGWDENKQTTFSQRKKENADDYRYFPDPDIPKLHISKIEAFSKENLKASLPELPSEKRLRYSALGLSVDDVEVFVQDLDLGNFYDEEVMQKTDDKKVLKTAANYIISDIRGVTYTSKTLNNLRQGTYFELIELLSQNKISSRVAKDLLPRIIKEGGSPRAIAEKEGLLQVQDTALLEKTAEQVISENPDAAEQYKGGKKESLQFLVGQGMKLTKGAANPSELSAIISQKLN